MTDIENKPIPPSKTAEVAKPEPFQNTVPANWQLLEAEGKRIQGYNPISGEKFEGTMAEFNQRLRAGVAKGN